MKRVSLLFLVAAATTLLAPLAANAAPRMYVGFHDDVNFRWVDNRPEMLEPGARRERDDRAHARRLVEDRSQAAEERLESLRPRLSAQRRRRARPQRAGTWPRGADHDLGYAEVGERRQDAEQRAAEDERPHRLLEGDRRALLGPVRRLPLRGQILDLERVEPAALPVAAVRLQGPLGRAEALRQARRRRLRRASRRATGEPSSRSARPPRTAETRS